MCKIKITGICSKTNRVKTLISHYNTTARDTVKRAMIEHSKEFKGGKFKVDSIEIV